MARRRTQPRFDPYAILAALEKERTAYVLIGAFARVIEGSDEITLGLDLTPSMRPDNLRRLELALEAISARRADGRAPELEGTDFEREPVVELETDHGRVKVVPFPEGTRGYDDLRRAAIREPIGRGLRPSVASPSDLARMLGALGREEDVPKLVMMRRLIELDRDRGLSIEW
ncbi:MAG TPA: hypothetical protein VNJ46_07380 [Gaiellaceae bacterium]|nr:hypothetical protein [Gaiellaceae bacterium]